MRPRTATIQVWKRNGIWYVEIGDPKASAPAIVIEDESLEDALILAIVSWKEREGLGD